MSNRKRRPAKQPAPKSQSSTKTRPKCVPTKTTPCPTTTTNGGTRQFGTSAGDQENHVNVPPEMIQDLHGNDFIKSMLA